MTLMIATALAALLGVQQGEAEIRGTVVDEAGRPASGAAVVVSRRKLEPDGGSSAIAATSADAQGRFTLRVPVEATRDWWFVWAEREGRGLGLAAVMASSAPGRVGPPLAIGLMPEGRRTITLTSHEGRPIAGAAIAPYAVNRDAVRPGLANMPEALASRLGATTDDRGRATIRGLAKDDMLLAVRVAIPGVGSQAVDLVGRDQIRSREWPPARSRSESLTLGLPAFGRLAGSVRRPDGSPARGVDVEVWSRGTGNSGPAPVRFADRPLLTGPDGDFRTPVGLLSGLLHRVVIRPSGFEPILSEWGEVAPGAGSGAIPLTLHPLRDASGRVIDRRGHPVAGATVFQSGDGPEPTSATTDSDGRFRLPGFGRGPVSVFARADRFRFHGHRLEQATDGVEIVLTRLDEAPDSAMTTLDLPITAEQRKALAHRLLDPYLEKALSSKEDVGKTWALRSLLHIDPAEALEALERTTFKRPSSPALIREEAAVELARDDPEEAEAVVEAIGDPTFRVSAMLALWRKLPGSEGKRRRALVRRAIPLAEALTDPSRKAWTLGEIADALLDLGDAEAARPILERGRALADSIVEKTDYGRGALVMALARVDLPAALERAREVPDKGERGRLLRNIAARRAKLDPAGAGRVLDAIDDPAERYGAPERICRDLAATDPAAARRIAEAQEPGEDRARALVFLAVGRKDRDRTGALAAFREAMGELDRMAARTPIGPWTAQAVAALLPVVEAIDPALVPEVFWRALALRPPRYDARLLCGFGAWSFPLMLARYDRRVAADLFAPALAFARRHPEDPISGSPTVVMTLGMIDPLAAVAFVEAMPPEPGLETNGANWSRIILSDSLARSKESRWSDLWRTFSGLGGVLGDGDLW